MKLYGIFLVLFQLVCATISASPVETLNVKNSVTVNDPALLRSNQDRVIASAGAAAFDENVSKARQKNKVSQPTISAIAGRQVSRKETFAKYYQYLTTDIFHPQSVLPELYIARLSIHQLVSEDVLPEITLPLNNDLRRLRVVANTKTIPSAPLQIVSLPPLVDATTFQTSASYHFSSTDFHHYLFRLKPF